MFEPKSEWHPWFNCVETKLLGITNLSSSFKRVCLVSRESKTVAEGEGGFEN